MAADILVRMLEAQLDLQENVFGYDFRTMSETMRAEYIRTMVLALTDEAHEALHETPWKGWKKDMVYDRSAYFGELVDAWTILLNLMLVTGISPEILANELDVRYEEKRRLNVLRQKDGYIV